MKVEYKLFVAIGAFFTVVGLIYGFFTRWDEPVGPFGLLLSAGLSLRQSSPVGLLLESNGF